MRKHTMQILAVAGLLTLTATFGVACGGGSDDTSSSGESTSTSSGESKPLRVIMSDTQSLTMIGVDAGMDMGLFKDKNLDVEVTASENVSQALATGDADVGIASPNRFIGAMLQGLDAKLVGPTINTWGQYIIVGKDVKAKTPEDWKGGRIGISSFGSAGHFSGVKFAEAQGWKESDYEIVTLGNLDGLKAALRSGTIDGFMWSAQAAFGLEEEGTARVLGAVGEYMGPNPLDVIAVSEDALKNRPDDIRKFLDGFYEAQRRFKNDPDLAAKSFEKWGIAGPVTPRVLELGLPLLSTDHTFTDEMFDNMAEATVFTIDGAKTTGKEVKGMYLDYTTL